MDIIIGITSILGALFVGLTAVAAYLQPAEERWKLLNFIIGGATAIGILAILSFVGHFLHYGYNMIFK